MRAVKKVTFYASERFVCERAWWERLLGMLPRPHPTILRLAPNVYFGHPETIEQLKTEVMLRATKADGLTKKLARAKKSS